MRQRILPVLVFLLAALLLPPLALGKFPALSLPSFAPQSADEEDLGWIGESVPSSQASRGRGGHTPGGQPSGHHRVQNPQLCHRAGGNSLGAGLCPGER